jgi:uncharacterized protein
MTGSCKTRFVVDSMLGRLSKWLRVMGCDAHYQPFYGSGMIELLIHDGRLLLSRNRRMTDKYNPSLLIESDHVQIQLQEIFNKCYIPCDSSQWFTRCLACNIPLTRISPDEAKEQIPEYILSQTNSEIHFCPSCRRCFWPGSHKTRMLDQISGWLLRDALFTNNKTK